MAATITTNTTYNQPGIAINAPQTSTIGFGPAQVATFNATETFLDCSKGSHFQLTLTANLSALTALNPQDGQEIQIRLIQDATGSRTVTWNSWQWHSGTAPTLTTTANHYDVVRGVWSDKLGKWLNTVAPMLDLS